jgi:hypothetical protein
MRYPAVISSYSAPPNESEDTIAESLANFEKLKYCVVVGFSGIRIFPCTGLHQRAVREGVIEAGDPLLKPKYYISPGIEYDRMNRMAAEGLKGRHDRVFPPLRAICLRLRRETILKIRVIRGEKIFFSMPL